MKKDMKKPDEMKQYTKAFNGPTKQPAMPMLMPMKGDDKKPGKHKAGAC